MKTISIHLVSEMDNSDQYRFQSTVTFVNKQKEIREKYFLRERGRERERESGERQH